MSTLLDTRGTVCGAEDCQFHFLDPLPADLAADGWMQSMRDHFMWCHEPSRHVIVVSRNRDTGLFRTDSDQCDVAGNPMVTGFNLPPASKEIALERGKALRAAILCWFAPDPKIAEDAERMQARLRQIKESGW